jgi:hypothetical protein
MEASEVDCLIHHRADRSTLALDRGLEMSVRLFEESGDFCQELRMEELEQLVWRVKSGFVMAENEVVPIDLRNAVDGLRDSMFVERSRLYLAAIFYNIHL